MTTPTAQAAHILDVLERLLRALARHQDQFRFSGQETPRQLVVAASYACDDYPRIVGVKGTMVHALKRLVQEVADSQGVTIEFDLIAPKYRGHGQPLGFERKDRWPQDQVTQLVRDLVSLLARDITVEAEHTAPMMTYWLSYQGQEDMSQQFVADMALVFRLAGRVCGRWIEVKQA